MMDLEKAKTEAPLPVDAPELRIPVPRGPLPVAPPRPDKKAVEISIDGQPVSIPEGVTLLEAARSLGIDTPTLCYLENLTPVNVCRICVVELEGSRTLVPACSRKAEPGMVVKTDSERVRLSRRLVLELLSSSVDVSTAPQLQSYMKRYAAEPERFGCAASGGAGAGQSEAGDSPTHSSAAATVEQPVKIDNELYVRDYGKCILCYKCVEACGEDAQNTFAIAVAGRGFSARISTEYEVPLPDSACVYCGNCIGVCPTGALMFRSEYEMRQAGTWDEQQQKQTDTICPYCGVGCTLTLHVQENNIVKATSPLDQEVTHGHLCIKGRFGWQFVQNRKKESEK
jgi:predicted molibdopterin-dependent oxidoreductase YjgC